MVSASVRGIGVAVIESKCGAILSFLTKRLLWAVPNRCCSYITTNARFLNLTVFWIRVCVPIKIGISPFATHFKSCAREIVVQPLGFNLEGNFLQPEPVMRPIWTLGIFASNTECPLKYSIKDSKC